MSSDFGFTWYLAAISLCLKVLAKRKRMLHVSLWHSLLAWMYLTRVRESLTWSQSVAQLGYWIKRSRWSSDKCNPRCRLASPAPPSLFCHFYTACGKTGQVMRWGPTPGMVTIEKSWILNCVLLKTLRFLREQLHFYLISTGSITP